MSNLNTSVKFDVLRGWPHGGAIEDAFKVTAGDTVKEGHIVVLTADGLELVSGTVPLEGANSRLGMRMVIQGNDQFDGKFTGKAVVLRGKFTVKTEKFVSGSYSVGEAVTANPTVGATQGYLKKLTANTPADPLADPPTLEVPNGEQIVGYVEEYDSVNGTLVVAMNL